MMERKIGKGKIIIVLVVIVVVLAAVVGWFSGILGGISEAEAKEIAYSQVPGAAEADNAIVTTDFDDLSKEYEVQFLHENVLYEFTILARNGRIVNQNMEGVAVQQPQQEQQPEGQPAQQQQPAEGTNQTDIGIERAREIALEQVTGAAAGDVVRAEVDNDDGRMVYEVEIRYDGREYDFDIDAATGEILSQSSESIFD